MKDKKLLCREERKREKKGGPEKGHTKLIAGKSKVRTWAPCKLEQQLLLCEPLFYASELFPACQAPQEHGVQGLTGQGMGPCPCHTTSSD
jgi:hypothetical protein